MRLATLRVGTTTRAALDFTTHWRLLPFDDLAEALRAVRGELVELAELRGEGTVQPDQARFAPAVRSPGAIVCLGLNFAQHVDEMGHGERPSYPTLFAKFPRSLTGPYDPIELPPDSTQVDWEVEVGVVIGAPARFVDPARALDHVAGYVVVNDVSMRDFQRRTSQFLQGKIFEASTPVGPWMVTRDEVDDARNLRLTTRVNGETMQEGSSADMLFGVAETIAYLSRILTLEPGDLISMGTPAGVGAGRTPPMFLRAGDILETEVEGIGVLRNEIVATSSQRQSQLA